MAREKTFVFICTGDDCQVAGAKSLCRVVKETQGYKLVKTKCLDVCKKAPNMILHEALYSKMTKNSLKSLLVT